MSSPHPHCAPREARRMPTDNQPAIALAAWPATDDVVLKLAVECGVAIESLGGAHSALKFSKPWDSQAVAARWRAMLYDAAFSAECVQRMHALDEKDVIAAVERACADFGAHGASLEGALRAAGLGCRRASAVVDGDETDDDEVPPRFDDAEQAILMCSTSEADVDANAGARAMGDDDSERALKRIQALERSAQAASARLATSKGALAELIGSNTTFAIDKREVVIGRSTEDQKVDVNLCLEGNASKISRQQAFLKLRWNGEFALRNVGRRPIWVSNQPLTTGQRCVLAPHTLIEVGGMRLLFMPNAKLIRAEAPEGAA